MSRPWVLFWGPIHACDTHRNELYKRGLGNHEGAPERGDESDECDICAIVDRHKKGAIA